MTRRRPQTHRCAAFTLIELLVVIGIMLAVMAMLAPAFTGLKNAADVTNGAYAIAGFLEQARNHAVSKNTFVWVGFYEEAAGTTTPTAGPPPYLGKGQLIIAAVASKDGSTTCEDPDSTSSAPIPLTASLIHPVGKLLRIENAHMADIGPPVPAPNQNPNTIDGRSDLPYTYGNPFDYQNRISSDDTHSPTNQTRFPFVAQGYTFYKTIRFSPAGEANINATYSLRRVAEIGLIPTHGTTVEVNNRNVVAIQFTGLGGNFKIFRR